MKLNEVKQFDEQASLKEGFVHSFSNGDQQLDESLSSMLDTLKSFFNNLRSKRMKAKVLVRDDERVFFVDMDDKLGAVHFDRSRITNEIEFDNFQQMEDTIEQYKEDGFKVQTRDKHIFKNIRQYIRMLSTKAFGYSIITGVAGLIVTMSNPVLASAFLGTSAVMAGGGWLALHVGKEPKSEPDDLQYYEL